MTAVAEASRKAKKPKAPSPENSREGSPIDIDKTLTRTYSKRNCGAKALSV